MASKLAKKELVDYVNSRIDLINQKKQIVVSDKGNTLHIVIPFNKMIYDKGFINIYGTLNSKPYFGIITYNKANASLYNVINPENRIYLISASVEENRLLRVMLFVNSYSVITLDSNDYFEQVII